MDLAVNPFGTRIIQKYIETAKLEVEIAMIGTSIEANILKLFLDQNGYHVVLKALFKFEQKSSHFIVQYLKQNMLQIAVSKQGCCAIQKIIEEPDIPFKSQLISKIVKLSSKLVNDSQGHYVINCVIGIRNDKINFQILTKLIDENQFVSLCKSKYPVYVLEKLFDCSSFKTRTKLVQSILFSKDALIDIILNAHGISSKCIPNILCSCP